MPKYGMGKAFFVFWLLIPVLVIAPARAADKRFCLVKEKTQILGDGNNNGG